MLRRYAPIKASRGTVWPPEVKTAILMRDDYTCVADRANLPVLDTCWGIAGIEVDHVRASHGIGMKSESTVENGVALCPPCHRFKTENGKIARPLLLAYIERATNPHAAHVDPCGLDCIARVPPA